MSINVIDASRPPAARDGPSRRDGDRLYVREPAPGERFAPGRVDDGRWRERRPVLRGNPSHARRRANDLRVQRELLRQGGGDRRATCGECRVQRTGGSFRKDYRVRGRAWRFSSLSAWSRTELLRHLA